MHHIILIGPRACGKTHVAEELARQLQRVYVDTDQYLTNKFHCTIAEFVEKNGWSAFRNKESEALISIFSEHRGKNIILATGGGIILREENRTLLKEEGIVIYLKVDEKILVKRLMSHPSFGHRPALTDYSLTEEVHNILEERIKIYEECADQIVDGSANVSDVAAAIRIVLHL